ncbi:MAG: AMP nucleosidase [Flavobacteriales bacterium]|nr:AMP nucleosidase [Flavobacteriales bacterium]
MGISKAKIVEDWLPRYTGAKLHELGEYILLTNFYKYLEVFSKIYSVEIKGLDKPMPHTTVNGVTLINFNMGSPNAATIIDLLTAIKPKACLFLGKCGGLKRKNKIGDFILPLAAIRGDGTSDDYLPKEVPALPAFKLQRAVSTTIRKHNRDYWTGTVYTTNRRVWEHDVNFKDYLKKIRAMAIDMETATLFVTGFANQISVGALLLVSDQPMIASGIKTQKSDKKVDKKYIEQHIKIGLDSLMEIKNNGESIKHLKYSY